MRIHWILIYVLLSFAPHSNGITAVEKATLQTEIETEIKSLLKDQLRAGEYFVYAIVKDAPESQDAATSTTLPYSPIQVDNSILQKILNRNLAAIDAFSVQVDVTLGFDERIPDAKRQLMETIVRERFGFDGTNRVLKVQSLELITPVIEGTEKLDLERAKMASEQAELKLQIERAKIEAQKKEFEMLQQLEEEKKKLSAATNPTAGPAVNVQNNTSTTPESAETKPNAPDEQTTGKLVFEGLKDIQIGLGLVLIAAVGGLLIIMSGRMFVSGMTPLSAAIESIGASMETAAKLSAPSQTSVTTVSGEKGEKSDSSSESAAQPAMIQGAVSGPVSEEFEEFVKIVQDKIDVLSKEKNYTFYRALNDLIDDRELLPMAASVLVSLDSDTTKSIVEDLSVDQITRIKAFLSSPGGLSKAKEIRMQALSNFYGRIAMDEYLDSPLMKLKDLTWLTKMSTQELAKFAADLPDAERPVFLACLTPERVKQILSGANEADRSTLLQAIAQIDTVTEETIEPTINKISERVGGSKDQPATGAKPAVDGARYLANIAADLTETDQKQLFELLGSKEALLKGIQEHFIPFSMVTKLPRDLVIEIFGDQQDQRIAQIVFDSAQEVRDRIIASLPEIRAESVKDELRTLDNDKFYEKRHRQTSAKLQKEISTYLLRLHAEGLLNLEDQQQTQGTEIDQTPAA